MKSILTLAALVGLVACSTANAASLQIVKTGNDLTNAVYLLGEADNGNFNTVIFKASPTAPATFAAQSSGLNAGAPRPAGDAFTYPNRLLNSDPLDFPGGQNWSLLGQVNTAAALEFTGGPLGGNVSTANEAGGRLFLGNIQLSSGVGVVNVQLVNATGAQVGPTLTGDLGAIPEPASVGLIGMAMLGLAGLRRRS
jgi:hypothetical protein